MRIEPYLNSLTPHAPLQTRGLLDAYKSRASRLMDECVSACVKLTPIDADAIDRCTAYAGHLGPYLIEAASVFLPDFTTEERLAFLEETLSKASGQLSMRKALYIHAEMVDTLHAIDPPLATAYIKRMADRAFETDQQSLLPSLVAAQATDAEVSCTHYFRLLKADLLTRENAQPQLQAVLTRQRYERALIVIGLHEWAASLPPSSRKRMIESDFGL